MTDSRPMNWSELRARVDELLVISESVSIERIREGLAGLLADLDTAAAALEER